MKTTYLASLFFLGLACVASAATTITLEPLNETNWTYGHRPDAANKKDFSLSDGTATIVDTWAQDYASLSLDNTYTLSAPGDKIEFSFTLNITAKSTTLTLALMGNNSTIVMGRGTYDDDNGKTNYALTDYVPDHDTNEKGIFAKGTVEDLKTNTLSSGVETGSFDFKGSVAWSEDLDAFVLNVSDGTKEAKNVVVGSSWSMNEVYLSGDAAATGSSISNLSLTVTQSVPEPATASLSLLGLAALMMRRRRA